MAALRYAVFGHPVAHSLSPRIHAAFAAQVGVELIYERVDAAPEAFVEAVTAFAREGGRGANVTLPHKPAALALCATLARAAGADLRATYERTRSEGFGPEVTRRILLGTYVLSAGYHDRYYRRAQEVRGLIARDYARAFDDVDVLFTPTTPTTAFPLGAVTDPYEMYLSDVFTVAANLVGIPAMSLPVGRVGALPVGGQLLAPHFEEARMFRVAAALERALGAEAHQ